MSQLAETRGEPGHDAGGVVHVCCCMDWGHLRGIIARTGAVSVEKASGSTGVSRCRRLDRHAQAGRGREGRGRSVARIVQRTQRQRQRHRQRHRTQRQRQREIRRASHQLPDRVLARRSRRHSHHSRRSHHRRPRSRSGRRRGRRRVRRRRGCGGGCGGRAARRLLLKPFEPAELVPKREGARRRRWLRLLRFRHWRWLGRGHRELQPLLPGCELALGFRLLLLGAATAAAKLRAARQAQCLHATKAVERTRQVQCSSGPPDEWD